MAHMGIHMVHRGAGLGLGIESRRIQVLLTDSWIHMGKLVFDILQSLVRVAV